MQHFEGTVDVKKISSTLKSVLLCGGGGGGEGGFKKREYISEDC
jgi:hypothetical protein